VFHFTHNTLYLAFRSKKSSSINVVLFTFLLAQTPHIALPLFQQTLNMGA